MKLHFRQVCQAAAKLTFFVFSWNAGWCLAQDVASGSLATDTATPKNEISFDREQVFDEVDALVDQYFLDESLVQTVWRPQLAAARQQALAAQDHDQFAAIINALLGQLHTSHTRYFSRLDPRRYQILGVFNQLYDASQADLFVYEGIGIDTQIVEDRVLVTAVFDGLPAASAELRFGDQIISVDGTPFHPILSFAGKAGSRVMLRIRRGQEEHLIPCDVQKLDGRTMFEDALRASVRVIEKQGTRIGYLHVWSYAGQKYQDMVTEILLWGELSQCDGLVLDLRDGWGGASPSYLNLFREPIFETESSSRTGPPRNYSGVWGKPVVLLTNGGSTSGKEMFVYGFRKLQLGTVVGEYTAGAVVAGRAFLLSNGDFLYLAVADVKVDGQKLEGQGVAPDLPVPRILTRANEYGPSDPQVEAALETVWRQTQSPSKRD